MASLPSIQQIEEADMKTEGLPHDVRVGDSVIVSSSIVEGKKKRTQKFEGLVVKIKGIRSRLTYTVRRVIGGVGVEKTILVHSPLVSEIQVTRKGKVRRARLTYLRERIGVRATRVKAKEKAVAKTK
jgi:large subunit ribosomal protein L19